MTEDEPAILLACWVCAERYAHIVKPSCVVCLGAGVFAAPIPIGIEPTVGARAASIHLGYRPAAVSVEARRRAGRIIPATRHARGIEDDVPPKDRNMIGRFAASLLAGKSLPPKAWSMILPTDRAKAADELVEMARKLAPDE